MMYTLLSGMRTDTREKRGRVIGMGSLQSRRAVIGEWGAESIIVYAVVNALKFVLCNVNT
jgi:hypothetical protein